MQSSRPTARPPRGRGRALVLGDARRETVEAAAAKARAVRRRAAARASGVAAASDGGATDGANDDDDDEFEAAEVGHDPDAPLFADAPYDADDQEADDIYEAVEARMRARRQKHTEARIQRELEEYRRANPTVQNQFADLKRKLSQVSEDEWASLPDIGDRSVQKRKLERFTPAPDMLAVAALPSTGVQSVHQDAPPVSTDLASIGKGKGSVMGHKLDRVSDSVSGQTNIDPSGYLTQMSGIHITSDSDVSDIKKARLLLKSVTTTNPRYAPGWIAAARLEEADGKLSAARDLAAEGCYHCSSEEDVWLEAARLHPADQAKRVLANAVKHVTKSVKIWLQATALETDTAAKKRILRKALQILPRSAKLWRTLVDLEDPESARVLLQRAVECVPSELDLWLALARLEPYKEAKRVLNRALSTLRAEPAIWITGAKLEESHSAGSEAADDPGTRVRRLIKRAVQNLSVDEHLIKRERWLEEASDAEAAGFPMTCDALVQDGLEVGVETLDRRRRFMQDAAEYEAKGKHTTVRAIFRKITSSFSGDEDAWLSAAEFELRAGSHDSFKDVIEKALKFCPRYESLWLMAAKHEWTSGRIAEAQGLLSRAYQANPESEAILLAAAKVELEADEIERARALLRKARRSAPSARVFMKSALLERRDKRHFHEIMLLHAGIDRYPSAPKLWLMCAQWHERHNESLVDANIESEEVDEVDFLAPMNAVGDATGIPAARVVYKEGCTQCPKSPSLWLGAARIEQRCGFPTRARAILESACKACKGTPGEDRLWAESARLEESAGDHAAAKSILARGLQGLKTSGRLWALAITYEPRARQRSKGVEALRARCDENAFVLVEVARLFWREGKAEKARSWFRQATTANPLIGDAWIGLYAFERSRKQADSVLRGIEGEVDSAPPKYGDLWTSVRKQPGNETLRASEVLRIAADAVSKPT